MNELFTSDTTIILQKYLCSKSWESFGASVISSLRPWYSHSSIHNLSSWEPEQGWPSSLIPSFSSPVPLLYNSLQACRWYLWVSYPRTHRVFILFILLCLPYCAKINHGAAGLNLGMGDQHGLGKAWGPGVGKPLIWEQSGVVALMWAMAVIWGETTSSVSCLGQGLGYGRIIWERQREMEYFVRMNGHTNKADGCRRSSGSLKQLCPSILQFSITGNFFRL